MNLASIRLLDQVGMSPTLKHLEAFGMDSKRLPRDLSLALGTAETTPWKLAEAYAGFASGGYGIDAWFVDRIVDAGGTTIYAADPVALCLECEEHWFDGRENNNADQDLPEFARNAKDREEEVDDGEEDAPPPLVSSEVPDYESAEDMLAQAGEWRPDYKETPQFRADRKTAKRVLTEQNAFLMYDMMRDVIKRGTGRRASDLNRPDIAGKTGTSNNRRDAWFAGFNGNLVGIAWVGFDDDARSLGAGEAGGSTALPMWKSFMAEALPGTNKAELPVPEGLVRVRISNKTGLLADYGETNSRFEYFRAGHEPEAGQDELEFDGSDAFVEDGGDSSIF
jgi:penicillin-binding protein 1A